jgi:hypothetical protein
LFAGKINENHDTARPSSRNEDVQMEFTQEEPDDGSENEMPMPDLLDDDKSSDYNADIHKLQDSDFGSEEADYDSLNEQSAEDLAQSATTSKKTQKSSHNANQKASRRSALIKSHQVKSSNVDGTTTVSKGKEKVCLTRLSYDTSSLLTLTSLLPHRVLTANYNL